MPASVAERLALKHCVRLTPETSFASGAAQ